MEDFEKIGGDIISYIGDPIRKAEELITQKPARFVLCGISGSGKTRSMEYANREDILDTHRSHRANILIFNL
jgi:signal recognition particle GTPase